MIDTPCGLLTDVTGGRHRGRRGFRTKTPVSGGVRHPDNFEWSWRWHSRHSVMRFSSASGPSLLLGVMWCTSSPIREPQFWQRHPSRFKTYRCNVKYSCGSTRSRGCLEMFTMLWSQSPGIPVARKKKAVRTADLTQALAVCYRRSPGSLPPRNPRRSSLGSSL